MPHYYVTLEENASKTVAPQLTTFPSKNRQKPPVRVHHIRQNDSFVDTSKAPSPIHAGFRGRGRELCTNQKRGYGNMCLAMSARGQRNSDAGLDVSPAVRDYLSLNGLDVCDWKFVDRLPPGPRFNYDSNNLALLKKLKSQ